MVDIFNVTIPQLTGEEERAAYIYVPEGEPGKRYPVLYMFDGHNLFFDKTASFGKSWGMLDFLEKSKTPIIVASVACNKHPENHPLGGRLSEYSPFSFSFPKIGDVKGRGKLTMDWMIGTFKPLIDSKYPTIPDREHTFIGGSSMGGLMTMYAVLEYNEVFSRGAAVSPAMFFSPEEVKEMITKAEVRPDTVLYMDVGEQELFGGFSEGIWGEAIYRLHQKHILLETRIVPDGLHSEVSWEKQIPFFMDTLFYGLDQ